MDWGWVRGLDLKWEGDWTGARRIWNAYSSLPAKIIRLHLKLLWIKGDYSLKDKKYVEMVLALPLSL